MVVVVILLLRMMMMMMTMVNVILILRMMMLALFLNVMYDWNVSKQYSNDNTAAAAFGDNVIHDDDEYDDDCTWK